MRKHLFAGFSDLRATVNVLADDGDSGAMLVRFDATQDGPYAGIPASGRAMVLEMVALLSFDDNGKVIRKRVFLDTNDILEMRP